MAGTGVGAGAAAGQAALAGLLETARSKYGVDLGGKYKSDEDALQGLLNAARMVGRRNEEAELGRYYREHYQQFQQYLAAQQNPQYQQQIAQQYGQRQEPEQENWWSPPEWNDGWNRYIVRDPATGEAMLAENTPLEVKTAIEKRRAYLEDWQHKLATNPVEAFKGLMGDVRKQITQEFEQRLEQIRENDRRQAEAQTILQRNSDWIYQKTATGQPVIDYATGRPALTVAGQYYTAKLLELQQAGVTDQAFMDRMASEATYAWMLKQQGSQSATPPAGAAGQAVPTTASSPAPQAGGAGAGAGRNAPAGLQGGRQPQAGRTPGDRPPQQGKTLREKLLSGAKDVPAQEFVNY